VTWFRFFRRKRADAELQEEIDAYLTEEVAENIGRGMSPREARRQARIKLGNPQRVREELWQQNTITALDKLWRDVRYAARALRRTPGFSAVAVLVMALGIGANVALFTVVRSVLLKPLPFKDPDRLLMLYERGIGGDFQGDQFNVVAGAMYGEWRKQNHSFADIALLGEDEFNLSGANGQLPERVRGANCTWNLLPTLGVKPVLGRNFTASDDEPSANGTVLLSWSLWKRRFAADPAILNQIIHLNGHAYTVIGILPAWFAFPNTSTQLWTPVYHDVPPEQMTSLGAHDFHVIGRLREGFTLTQGVADLSLISKHVHDQHLDNGFVGMAANARSLLDDMVGDIERPLYVLMAAAACLFLIACLNVANLLGARAAARRKELAIRSALGGGLLRLLRERLMESFLLAACGGIAGMMLAYGAIEWLVRTRQDMSRVDSIHIDGVVSAFTVGVVVLCALFSGLISAFSVQDKRVLATLHEGSRTYSPGRARATLRRALLMMELGLTVVLLVGAGLLLKSYRQLRATDIGCATRNVLTMTLDLSGDRYKERAQIVNFYTELLTRVRALPGVTAAGFVRAVPGQGYMGDQGFTIVEHPPLPQGQAQYAIDRWADPDYFQAMGIPIIRGHTFDADRKLDQANQAVISASFARQYFPDEDPIGKHIHHDGRVYEITGIVGDTRYWAAKPPEPIQYFPLFAGLWDYGTLVVRSDRDVEALALPVQRIVQALDRDLPVSDVLTMDQLLGKSTVDASFNATLLAAFAVLSLVLAAVGLFGVLSYIVAQRTSEIGIRIALGARRQQVLQQMLSDGLRPALFGLVAGLGASFATGRLISTMLYETQALDLTVYAAVTGSLLLVAALACVIPAWRASRLDPMQALRAE